MGNKESQFNGTSSIDGKDNNQTLDPTLIKSFTTELADGDSDLNLEKFQVVRILGNIRQYRLLTGLYDRAIRLSRDNRFFWHQLSLSLICDHRFSRASKVLKNCITQTEAGAAETRISDESILLEYMQLARIQIEQMDDIDLAETMTLKAINKSNGSWLAGRCYLLLAMIYSIKSQQSECFYTKKTLMADSIRKFERVIELDPHDDLAHFYCALEYANARNLSMAQERCQTALDLNMDNPYAIMLMALIFTAKKDYKGALELVINALADFPSHYGLLLLRLKLEEKYGRVEEALQTSKNLICFWRKTRCASEFMPTEENNTVNGGSGDVGVKTVENFLNSCGKQQLVSKEAIGPLTPLLTAPLGIATTPSSYFTAPTPNIPAEMTPYPSTDNLSTLGPPPAVSSEYGAPSSTDSASIISSSSKSWISYSSFRLQADIWVELAEFFIEMDRLHDVQACVEEACVIYPNSHQALYLKGHLYLARAEKCVHVDPSLSKRLRGEAKNCLLGAISISTGHVSSLACLGRLYHAEGSLKMAEKMFRDSIAYDQFNFRNWHKLGCVLAQLNQNDEALECFQMSASLETSNPIIPFKVIPRLLNTHCN